MEGIVNHIMFPMHAAAADGEVKTLRDLLSKGVHRVDDRDYDGATPLYYAAAGGHVDACRLLIEEFHAIIDAPKCESGEIETKNAEATPLLIATRNGYIETVQYLLQAGAFVDHQKKRGATPLFIAAQSGFLHITRVLIEQGRATVDIPTEYGATPLYIASQNGHVEIVEYLLSRNADVNRLRDCNISALYIASQNGHAAVTRVLVAAGGDPKTVREGGITPLYIAAQHGHLDVINFLLEVWPEGVTALTDHGISPLMIAAQGGFLESIVALHEAGADLFHTTTFPLDALDIAMRSGSVAIVRYFLAHTGDVARRTPRVSVGAPDNVLEYLSKIEHFTTLQIAVDARLPNAIVKCSREENMDPHCSFAGTPSAWQLATTRSLPDSPPVSEEVVRLLRSILSPFGPWNAHLFPARVSQQALQVLCLAQRIESQACLSMFVPPEIWLTIISFYRHPRVWHEGDWAPVVQEEDEAMW